MGLFGSSKDAVALCEALRKGEDAEAIALLDKVKDVTASCKGDRVPFLEACKYGRRRVLIRILKAHDDDVRKLDKSWLSKGLLMSCGERTDRGIVLMLLERGANIEEKDKEWNTPLINCCRKGDNLASPMVHAARLWVATKLIEKGAKFEERNLDKKTALMVAVEYLFEKMAHLLIERGADLESIERWMKQSKANQENWCAGSCMAKFIWNEETEHSRKYVAGLKEQFTSKFDEDGNGTLDKKELMMFIAYNVKIQAMQGRGTSIPGVDNAAKLDVDQIATLMEQRCPEMVKGYLATDKDNDGTYDWSELLPIAKDFFCNLWTSRKPIDDDGVPDYPDDEKHVFKHAVKDELFLHLVKKTKAPKQERKAFELEGWQAVKDETHNRFYYFNKYTRVATWDKPTEPANPPPEAPLPADWREATDNLGRKYYYHKKTREATWERPS